MKRIFSFILTTCIIISLFSAIGSIGVFAASGDLIFDMDVSGFDKSIPGNYGVKGKDGYGEDSTVAFGGNSSAVASKKDFVNANSDKVDYINFTNNNAAGYNFRVDIPELANKSFTAEFWVRTKIDSANYPYLAFLGGNPTSAGLVNAVCIESYQGYFYQTWGASTRAQLSDTEWQQVALIRERTETGMNTKFYVNGVEKSSKTITAEWADEHTATFYLPKHNNGLNAYACPAKIDLASLKLYDGVLDANTIKAHHDAEAMDYTKGWNVDVDFKNTSDNVWGLSKGGSAVLATDANVPSDGAVAFVNSNSNFNASRDENGYLTLAVKTPNASSGMNMIVNMPTALKCGTYEIEFSAYYPDETVANGTIKETQLSFEGTKGSQTKLTEFTTYSGSPALAAGGGTWYDVQRNSDREFIVKAVFSSPSPDADWNVKVYNEYRAPDNPIRTMTISRATVGDLKGAGLKLWCSTSYGGFQNTNTKLGYIKANYNPNVISGIEVTDSMGNTVTDFTGVTEINYDADVYGGGANVVVALYDGDSLEASRVHTFDGTNDITGTFSNLDITGKGEVKVFMISKDFGKLVPKCRSFTYGE